MATDRGASVWGVPAKHLSLVTLTFQNSALILIMHYSRIMPPVDGFRYLASTSVFLNEAIKLAISASVAFREMSNELPPDTPVTTLLQTFTTAVVANESWKLAIPAAMYTLQNTLQYVAVSNLDPSTFQVTYQLKILTTAIFSVLLLGRSLSARKWLSLLLLIVGVSIVQLPEQTAEVIVDGSKTDGAKLVRRALGYVGSVASQVSHALVNTRGVTDNTSAPNNALHHPKMNRSVGLLAVLVSCALSGLAGVIFEKVLKDAAPSAKPVSLWVRNTQLSFWSIFPSLFVGVLWVDGQTISKTGFFAGYNWVVWAAIGFQAAGGIIVSLVIKFADNIAKNFATSISIIASAVASAYFFDFRINLQFLIGTSVVIMATYLYSQPDRGAPSYTKIVDTEQSTVDESAPSRPSTPNADRKKRDA